MKIQRNQNVRTFDSLHGGDVFRDPSEGILYIKVCDKPNAVDLEDGISCNFSEDFEVIPVSGTFVEDSDES